MQSISKISSSEIFRKRLLSFLMQKMQWREYLAIWHHLAKVIRKNTVANLIKAFQTNDYRLLIRARNVKGDMIFTKGIR